MTRRWYLAGTGRHASSEDPFKLGFGVPSSRTCVQDWKSSVHPCVSGERTGTSIRNQWVNGNEPGWGALDYRLTTNQWGESGQFAGVGGQRQVVVLRVALQSMGDRSLVFLPVAEEEGKFVRRQVRLWPARGTPPMSSPTSAGLMRCLPAALA
jgi:hypothetical protein